MATAVSAKRTANCQHPGRGSFRNTGPGECPLLRLSPQHGAPRAGEEAGLDEQRHDERPRHGLAVETLHGKPLRTAPLDEPYERRERGP